MSPFVSFLSDRIKKALPMVEATYKDLHQNPELALQEARTAGIVAQKLREAGFEVTEKVGRTGVVGILKNGAGPTVMLRADMDALPMKEDTGVPYASTKEAVNAKGETVPVAHACGHDMHTSWLVGAATVLAQAREAWHGTLMTVFQPAEETAQGAQAMIDDGLLERFPKPDVILGQHLLQFRAGTVGYHAGQILTSGDSLLVRFFGKGAHGGMPQNGIDPIVMASAAVLRLQTIVSREISPQAQVVVTVGEFHGGTAENIIPAEAYIKLNVRTTDQAARDHVLAAIKRICVAEARASNAPKDPEFEEINSYPLTVNDAEVTRKVTDAFRGQFGDQLTEVPPQGASEDFGRYGNAWKAPYMYWFVGGTAPEKYDQAVREGAVDRLPGPHSPFWAPALYPTLQTGLETMLTAASVWLAK
ncbi:amidohydrolase [Geomonas subterranea]|uniref:Amidohydrolase n=1 Tax=Geomonas subterranea TaxID=2847989 RepID=A0ABX8LLH2_9BACT|nr:MULTISPECIES: amidohydrolase [Geomonas]QXE90405.1 amidohydrolase [Geomonas subterranea]QXM11520.1 amidohydrolase [Geomonas subterranea]